MTKTIVLIVAAGRGMRAGGKQPKQYASLGNKAVLMRTIEAFIDHPLIDGVITVIHPDDRTLYKTATSVFDERLLAPVHGANTRQQSVYNGLKALSGYHPDFVLIHDAARPFITNDLIGKVISTLESHEAVLPVLPLSDTIKQVEDGAVTKTIARSQLFGAQTPQGFHFPLILDLHKRAQEVNDVEFTDDASIAEWAGIAVKTIKGTLANQKLTTPHDMQLARLVLADKGAAQMEYRTGLGFDVHRFEPGDGVILCGITIPFDKQLKGHSDADAAMHAVTDAIYGTIGEGDIGEHFPPNQAQWRGAASSVFLEHAVGLVRKRGGKLVNIDVTIICEQPKISPHREMMRAELSRIMGVDVSRVAVKATTTEKLGFTGRNEGIAAKAVATITLPATLEQVDV